MAISGIGSNFLNGLTDMTAAQAKVEQADFEALLRKAQADQDDAKLKEACEEFEAYYLNKVFKDMRKSIPKANLYEKAEGHDIYEDMLYEAYSKEIAKGSAAGIKDMLYKQLSKNSQNLKES